MKFLVLISDKIEEFATGDVPYDNVCSVHGADFKDVETLLEVVKAGKIAIAIQKEGDEE